VANKEARIGMTYQLRSVSHSLSRERERGWRITNFLATQKLGVALLHRSSAEWFNAATLWEKASGESLCFCSIESDESRIWWKRSQL